MTGSLQAWLEVAWEDGFDEAGAESLGGKVLGTQKWIGTTEVIIDLEAGGDSLLDGKVLDSMTSQITRTVNKHVPYCTHQAATLLRYFGISAHIVDFTGRMEPGSHVSANNAFKRLPDGRISHTSIECDLCGR